MFLFAEQHRDTNIGETCHAGLAPRTTCMRHLNHLARRGWVAFAADVADRRSRYARLTAKGLSITEAYLEHVAALEQLEAAQ